MGSHEDVDWRTEVQRLWIFGDGQPAFDFDTVISEGHTSRLSIMENPVETGVLVADHSFMMPRELEIYGVVSDVWLGMRDPDNGTRPGPLNLDKPWLVPASSGDSSSRCQRAFQLLLGKQASGDPFDVQAGLRLYQNMLCPEITANQDKRTAGALLFRAVLREVQFRSTQTVVYTPRADKKTTRQAAKKTTTGEQQAVAPPVEKQVSVEKQVLRALGLVK